MTETESVATQARENGPVVVAKDVTRRYGAGDTAVDALRGVSVERARGELTAVMGPSGSGKSTLMHILAGLDRPTSGTVAIAGTEITTLGDTDLTKLRRKHIGFVFQFFNLLPMLTAEENIVAAALDRRREAGPGLVRRPDQVGRARPTGCTHRPSELSGGQQQRVAIARALVSRPDRDLRRRADRQPRLEDERRDPRAPAPLGARPRADHRDGDPRCARRGDRRPRPLPRRRPDRARSCAEPSAHEIVAGDGADRRRVTRFALKGMLGRKLRTVLTALAIVLGVAMVSGTYVLTDSIDKAFNTIFTEIYRGTDATITGKTAFDLGRQRQRRAALRRVAARRGPAAAGRRPGAIGGRRRRRAADRLRREGDRVRRRPEPRLQRRPDAARVQQPRRSSKGTGRRRARSSSTSRPRARRTSRSARTSASRRRGRSRRFGSPASSSSAPSPRSAAPRSRGSTCRPRSELFDKMGKLDQIRVAAKDGVPPEKLVAEIRKILPPGTQVRTGDAQAAEDASEHERVHRLPAEVPARVRRHRALRRRVRDRELALDHDRPAHARVRDAAHARGVAPAGARRRS